MGSEMCIRDSNERAQREVLIAAFELALDRLGSGARRQPRTHRPGDLPQEATDLRLATVGERGDASLAEPAAVRVEDYLAELGAALANQLIGTPGPLGDLSLESHITDSNYYQ